MLFLLNPVLSVHNPVPPVPRPDVPSAEEGRYMYTMHLLGCYLFSYLRKSGALCVSEHAGTLVRIIIRIMLLCLHCEMENYS